MTLCEDVVSLVDYLKTKPTGASMPEAKSALTGKLLDPRKVTAYLLWGFISKDGEKFKLQTRGWELARKTKTQVQVFREVLDSIVPYRSVLEWMFHQKLEEVSNNDIASHWHEHHSDYLGTTNENTIKDQAVCFMRVCETAELGVMKIGRHGTQTRLSINKEELKLYVEAGPSTPPWTEPKEQLIVPEVTQITSETNTVQIKNEKIPAEEETDLRVFISHGKNQELVEQVETLLSLADINSEIAVKEETSAIPVPDKVFNAMRRCSAGIIIVSVDEGNKDTSGNYRINENVLIEIGAAFVLYERKVVLLWDKRMAVPSNLQGLYRCEFEGNDLNWGAGMKLMKAIKGFKKKI
jgi:hypothetical protein